MSRAESDDWRGLSSSVPPGGVCVALFEKRGHLESAGRARPLTEPLPALRTVAAEFKLAL